MFVDGIKLVCFGASYAVALVGDISAWFTASKVRRAISFGFGAAGVLAHTLYLAYRVLGRNVPPLSSSFDSLLVVAWVLAVAYLFLHWHFPNLAVGMFTLPMVLGLVVFAAFVGDTGARDLRGWIQIFGIMHGALLVAGALAVSGGFLAGLMYLVQARRLKAKHLPGAGLDLPSLELLERANWRGIAIGFPLLTVGLATGCVLAVEELRRGNTEIRWADPKVLCAIMLWIVLGGLVLARREPGLRGRRVALLTVVAFALLIFTIAGVDLMLDSWHPAIRGGGS
jgi:ABC-type uncharacterized transport system permease subunit